MRPQKYRYERIQICYPWLEINYDGLIQRRRRKETGKVRNWENKKENVIIKEFLKRNISHNYEEVWPSASAPRGQGGSWQE